MRENEELRLIKKLSKEFKGMKERFKNPNITIFKKNAELFIKHLCIAYDINDLKLNHLAITAYNEVREILENRIQNKSEKNITEIKYFTLVLNAYMENFYQQASKHYN